MTPFQQRIALLLCLVVFATGQLPAVSYAGPTPSSMGTTNAGTRQNDIATIERSLADEGVQEALRRAGTNPEQLRLLIPRMSDHDVHQLATNMDGVKSGGIIVEILVIVLLVLLIIYLLDRV